MKILLLNLLIITAGCNSFPIISLRDEVVIQEYPKHINKTTHETIQTSLKWLASVQGANGCWDDGGGGGFDNGTWTVAATSLLGLSFVASGSDMETGPYAYNVKKVALYLLNVQNENGEFVTEGDKVRAMYGHCFALFFLSEIYGTEKDEIIAQRIAASIKKAIIVVEKCQSEKGGWYYGFENNNDEGSVTITAVQALRAAKNAGFNVNIKTIEKGLDYLTGCQNPDGGIKYSWNSNGGTDSRPAISAASLASFYMCGIYPKDENDNRKHINSVKKLIHYLDRVYSVQIVPMEVTAFPFYSNFYLAQSMWLSGDEKHDIYYPKIRDWLLSRDNRHASLPVWNHDQSCGNVYVNTAMALLVLQIPYKYLPILER